MDEQKYMDDFKTLGIPIIVSPISHPDVSGLPAIRALNISLVTFDRKKGSVHSNIVRTSADCSNCLRKIKRKMEYNNPA